MVVGRNIYWVEHIFHHFDMAGRIQLKHTFQQLKQILFHFKKNIVLHQLHDAMHIICTYFVILLAQF